MGTTSIWNIKEELVVFLRNNDILPTGTRGVTTHTDTGSFAGQSSYTVSNDPTLLKNIRSIEVGAVFLSFGADYDVNYETGEISFSVAQTGAYEIIYDSGSTDRIYPDFPQEHLTLSQFPRIAVEIISGTTEEMALGATTTHNEFQVSVVVYSKDQSEVEQLISAVRTAINDNKKDLYYVPFITATGLGPILVSPFGDNKIMQRNQDFIGRFVFDEQ